MMKSIPTRTFGALGLLLFALSACQPRHPEVACHGIPEEVALDTSLDKFGQATAQKYGMRFLFVGKVEDNVLARYSLAFLCPKECSLAEGQQLAANVSRDFWEMLQHDQSVKEHFELVRDRMFNSKHEKVEMMRAAFRIGFWNEEVNRPKPPFLAEILLNDNMFSYYEADPETQALRLVLQEPYPKTMAHLASVEKGTFDGG